MTTKKKKMENPTEKKEKISMCDFPCDLMLNILSRIPVKTLFRFKCVSKQFLNFISDPCLHRLHYTRSCKKPFALSLTHLSYDSDKYKDFTIHLSSTDQEDKIVNKFTGKIKADLYPVTVLSSRNHLICLPSTEDHIYVCNPSTQQIVELPHTQSSPTVWRSQSDHVGFGYVPSTMEYKVVRLFSRVGEHYEYTKDYWMRCEVLTISNSRGYNLGSNISSWRRLEENCPYFTYDHPVFVNGSIHWQIFNGRDDKYIISLSLEDEKFSIVPPPPCVYVYSYYFGLVELRENLWLVKVDHESMEMWVMKDWEKYEWVMEHKIDASIVRNILFAVPLDIDDQNEKILFKMYPDKLKNYDIKSKTFVDGEEEKNQFHFCYYIDSFFSLGSF